MVCFKVGITTGMTVGTFTELRVTNQGRNTHDHVALIRPAPFLSTFSGPGDSGTVEFGIQEGLACPLGIHQGTFGHGGTPQGRSKCYSLPQAMHALKDHNGGVHIDFAIQSVRFNQSATCVWKCELVSGGSLGLELMLMLPAGELGVV